MGKYCVGITLPEMLIAVLILSVLSNLSMPGLNNLSQKIDSETTLKQLNTMISLARSSAISLGSMVTLCKSTDGLKCGGDWTEGMLLFTDANANRIVDGSDSILRVKLGLETRGTVVFRAFQNKQYLQFTALGFTNYQNGNFTWCPLNKDNRLAQQLIITRTGRTRLAIDRDGDGIRENSRGQDLTCP